MGQLPFSIRTGAWALASSLLLAGCASTRLDEAPVTDRAAIPAPAAGAVAPGQARSAVAPVIAARPAAGGSVPAGVGRVVFFEYDSATIRPEFQPLVDGHARFLAAREDRRLTIAGHTDERGGREYNLALGQQRAEAVRRALQLLGVRATQIETISFGEEKPTAGTHEEAAWSRNRRAELDYR